MFLSRSWMMITALRHFQPPLSTAHNARMELPFGGCFRQDLLMKRPHNFIDAQNAITLGATMPNQKLHTHTHTHTHKEREKIHTFTLSPDTPLYTIEIEPSFQRV